MRLFSALIDTLQNHLPSTCFACRRFGHQSLCDECIHQFSKPQKRCSTCALPLPLPLPHLGESEITQCGGCLTLGSPLEYCAAVVDYAYPWNSLIAGFKYSDAGSLKAQSALARSMAWVTSQVAREDQFLQNALHHAVSCDWIMPIPLHPNRQKERGFNQALEFAKALFQTNELAKKRIRADLLMRIKATQTQADLPRDERHSNLKSAFAASPLKANLLAGRSVCLIDDVSTTGATLQSAAMALRNAGVQKVIALVFAKTA